jgi:hypothetical protein
MPVTVHVAGDGEQVVLVQYDIPQPDCFMLPVPSEPRYVAYVLRRAHFSQVIPVEKTCRIA